MLGQTGEIRGGAVSIDEPTTRRRLLGDVDPAEDGLLVLRSQAGDHAAFAKLYAWYAARLVRYCRTQLVHPDEAEDAAQESFARAWHALGELAGNRRFYPWLRVIAHNVCVDWNRQRRAEAFGDLELDRLSPRVASGDDEVIAAIDAALAVEALGHLSPRHREVLERREQENWSYQRIAEEKGVAVSTIETLLFRARRALRKEFHALAGGDGAAALFALRLKGWFTRTVAARTPVVSTTGDVPGLALRFVTISACAAASALAVAVAVGPRPHRDPPPTVISLGTAHQPPLLLASNGLSDVRDGFPRLLGVGSRDGVMVVANTPPMTDDLTHTLGQASDRDSARSSVGTAARSGIARQVVVTASTTGDHALANASATVTGADSRIKSVVPGAKRELGKEGNAVDSATRAVGSAATRIKHVPKVLKVDGAVAGAQAAGSLASPVSLVPGQATGSSGGSLPLSGVPTSPTDTTAAPDTDTAAGSVRCAVTRALSVIGASVTRCPPAP
jgi:RNA polymerase sigma-70 factor (ECF subfamily)